MSNHICLDSTYQYRARSKSSSLTFGDRFSDWTPMQFKKITHV